MLVEALLSETGHHAAFYTEDLKQISLTAIEIQWLLIQTWVNFLGKIGRLSHVP